MSEKPFDERILGQTQAEILEVNDLCPDDKFKRAMRGVVLSATDRMLYRLKEFYADKHNRNGPRRDNRQSEQPE